MPLRARSLLPLDAIVHVAIVVASQRRIIDYAGLRASPLDSVAELERARSIRSFYEALVLNAALDS